MRLFWSLIVLGLTFWLVYQMFWTYYEVLLRRDVPDLFAWDVVLFLHIVPLMAAWRCVRTFPRDEYSARLGRLDFALLLVWWFYLYVLIVMPWQYVVPDVPPITAISTPSTSLRRWLCSRLGRLLDHQQGPVEKALRQPVRHESLLFRQFNRGQLGHRAQASTTAAASTIFLWLPPWRGLTWIGLRTKAEKPRPIPREVSTVYGVWVARCSMIACFLLPLFAAWADVR